MSIRDWANNNSAVVTVGAVILLIFALFLLVRQCQGPEMGPRVTQQWFYDMNTNQMFTGDPNQIPPIQTDSGAYSPAEGIQVGAGVKAHVFACGECTPETRFIGYLEMYKPDAKEKMEQAMRAAQGDAPAAPEYTMMYEEGWIEGRLIKREKDENWVSAESEEGIAIIQELSRKCPEGERLKPCFPAVEE